MSALAPFVRAFDALASGYDKEAQGAGTPEIKWTAKVHSAALRHASANLRQQIATDLARLGPKPDDATFNPRGKA